MNTLLFDQTCGEEESGGQGSPVTDFKPECSITNTYLSNECQRLIKKKRRRKKVTLKLFF